MGGNCPCTAGIKSGVHRTACGPEPPKPKPTPQPRAGRACGRMGFASETLTGPYHYCQWIEQPNPQGLEDPVSAAKNGRVSPSTMHL